jgi:hypothetical protein
MEQAEHPGFDATVSSLKIVIRPVRVGEGDLLAGRENADLIVKGSTGNVLFRSAPPAPWTRNAIVSLLGRADVVRFVQREGYGDAYLGDRWIGSSEV